MKLSHFEPHLNHPHYLLNTDFLQFLHLVPSKDILVGFGKKDHCDLQEHHDYRKPLVKFFSIGVESMHAQRVSQHECQLDTKDIEYCKINMLKPALLFSFVHKRTPIDMLCNRHLHYTIDGGPKYLIISYFFIAYSWTTSSGSAIFSSTTFFLS